MPDVGAGRFVFGAVFWSAASTGPEDGSATMKPVQAATPARKWRRSVLEFGAAGVLSGAGSSDMVGFPGIVGGWLRAEWSNRPSIPIAYFARDSTSAGRLHGPVNATEKGVCSLPQTSSEQAGGASRFRDFPMNLRSGDAVAIFGCGATH
jgi:hypothetical protein